MLTVVGELCRAGAEVNEDLVWHDGSDAVVLDGSSSLSGGAHDVLEFTHAFMEHYQEQVALGLSLHECVNASIDALRGQFVPDSYVDGIVPSAAGVFLRETDIQIQVLSVADCSAWVLWRDGHVTTICEDSIGPFDAEAIGFAVKLSGELGLSVAEAMRLLQVRGRLLTNRLLMNMPFGYRALASNMAPLTSDDVVCLDKADVCCVLLCSDGFETAAEGFSSADFDIFAAYDELRQEEIADSTLCRRPRFKVSDDASALLIRFGDNPAENVART